MTERELRAVAEVLDFGYEPTQSIMQMAQAAISASDSRYVKGLVEALKSLRHDRFGSVDAVNQLIDDALQNLPEDLRK